MLATYIAELVIFVWLPGIEMFMIDGAGVNRSASLPPEILAETASGGNGVAEEEMDSFWHT